MTSDTNTPYADFSFVRYANCWEDAALLVQALRPKKGMRLLSIASAGDNSLALIARGADVLAVDLNPAQLACAELRREMIRALPLADFLRCIGVLASDSRWEAYRSVRERLTPITQAFWDSRREIIERGIIHAGKFERYFQIFRMYVLPLIHRSPVVEALLAPKELVERKVFYERRWNNLRWNLLFRIFFSRALMGRLGRDPAFFRQVEGNVAIRILARARYALTELDSSANPYLSYILTGNFHSAVPFYLRPENYSLIRANIDNLTLQQGAVDGVAAAQGARVFDGFNLSDIFEYLTPSACADVYGRLLASARPGARLAYWNMLVPRTCPHTMSARISQLDEEANALFAQDQAFFYSRFVLEEVL